MKYFGIEAGRHDEYMVALSPDFRIGVTPFHIHSDYRGYPVHCHFCIDLGFWYLHIRIGRSRVFDN